MGDSTIFIVLFIIATAVAIVVRRFSMPYSVALVLTGLFLGFFHIFQAPHLTKNLLFTVFLPGLLFEAAFHTDFQEFWRNRLTIMSLAFPGVAMAMALTTLILTPVAGLLGHGNFTWGQSMVFGALIAATDPIAVIAIFKELGGPRRLSVIMEGESLLNDGTGIVFFILSMSLATGTEVSILGLTSDFVSIVGVGLLIGSAVGFVVSQVIKRVDDAMIEITLTTLAAYGSFMAAEQFHYSGVIATVAAGMICGNYGARFGMSPSSHIAIESFWGYVAFALNSIVFLLIGFEVHIKALIDNWKLILIAYLAVTVGRVVVVSLASSMLRRTRERLPWSWSAVLAWGGLRGALPMVLVLSLPYNFPHRQLLVTVTFGVVILWILVHGLTLSQLLWRLGLVRGREERRAIELLRGKLMAAFAGQEALERLKRGRFRDSSLIENLRQEYEQTIQTLEQEMGKVELDPEQLHEEEKRWARRHLLIAEKRRVMDDFHEGRMSQWVYEKLLADIDARILEMETGTPD
jgi:monovalent cation:H+ antiporter, CPA1 family